MRYDPFLVSSIEAALPQIRSGINVALTIGGQTRYYTTADLPALRRLLVDQYHASGVRGVLPFE